MSITTANKAKGLRRMLKRCKQECGHSVEAKINFVF